MNAFVLPIVLQIIGVLVIIAEIILPSGGLLSVLAAGVIGYSLYAVFTEVSVTAGIAFVCADLVLIPAALLIGIKLLAKSPATLKKELSSADGVVAQHSDLEKCMGATGTALTDLRPAGSAMIDGTRMDVVTRGDYIEKNASLKVVAVTGNQVIVAKT